MISEITTFVQHQARALSMGDLERLLIDLPSLRRRFARISAHRYPFLAEQLRFLARFVEEEISRGQVGEIVGEASFALLYFQRATDSIPGLGLLDDAIIVRSPAPSRESFRKELARQRLKLAGSQFRR